MTHEEYSEATVTHTETSYIEDRPTNIDNNVYSEGSKDVKAAEQDDVSLEGICKEIRTLKSIMADITEDLRLLKEPDMKLLAITKAEKNNDNMNRTYDRIDEKSEELRKITKFHIKGRIRTKRGITFSKNLTTTADTHRKSSITNSRLIVESSEETSIISCTSSKSSDEEGVFYCG